MEAYAQSHAVHWTEEYDQEEGLYTVAETWRRVRGTEKIFADQDDVFSEKISIFAAEISGDLFLVIDQLFFEFFLIFRIFTLLDIVHNPFLTRKTPLFPFSRQNFFCIWPFPHKKNTFFTLFILSRTSDNTTYQNIGGAECMGRPPTSNFGGRPPSPLGFRPCVGEF